MVLRLEQLGGTNVKHLTKSNQNWQKTGLKDQTDMVWERKKKSKATESCATVVVGCRVHDSYRKGSRTIWQPFFKVVCSLRTMTPHMRLVAWEASLLMDIFPSLQIFIYLPVLFSLTN
jgi:hypothetical protein